MCGWKRERSYPLPLWERGRERQRRRMRGLYPRRQTLIRLASGDASHLLPQGEKGRTSPPSEIRDAALGGGLDAFLEVFGGAQLVLLDQFVVGCSKHTVGEAGAHGGAG